MERLPRGVITNKKEEKIIINKEGCVEGVSPYNKHPNKKKLGLLNLSFFQLKNVKSNISKTRANNKFSSN